MKFHKNLFDGSRAVPCGQIKEWLYGPEESGSRFRFAKAPKTRNCTLTRLTSRCILFDGENISFGASLVIYLNSTNIPPIMIINRIYETQNLLYINYQL